LATLLRPYRFGEELQNLLRCHELQRNLFSETAAANLDGLAEYYSQFAESMSKALNPVEANKHYSPFAVGEATSKSGQRYAYYEQTKR
jgi:protein-arginine kinase activator protein McsA